MSDHHTSGPGGPDNTRHNLTRRRDDDPGGDTHPTLPETKSSTMSHNRTIVSDDSPGDTRASLGNPRDRPDGDDTNSGFTTSDFPPIPTHTPYPLFEEVRRLKEDLEAERRKTATLEKELAAAKRWLSQAPVEVAALVSRNVTKNEAATAGASSAGVVGAGSIGAGSGSGHEDFRQRTGNPRSSFFSSNGPLDPSSRSSFSKTRIDPVYNYRANPNQNVRNAMAGGRARADDAHSRFLGPTSWLNKRTGGEHGPGSINIVDRGSGRGRDSGRTGHAPRGVRGGGFYDNPFPGPSAVADYSREDVGSLSNVQAPDDWGRYEARDGPSDAEKTGD